MREVGEVGRGGGVVERAGSVVGRELHRQGVEEGGREEGGGRGVERGINLHLSGRGGRRMRRPPVRF